MAVTDLRSWLILLCGLLFALQSRAAVLPPDRADVMYHKYDGGGMTIDGPSLLVRKSVSDNVSLSANYYVDQVSSASIDVVTTASPYTEERTEYTLSGDYLLNKTIISAGMTTSTENDYDANTWFFGISQDFFGDLSTLALSYSYGADSVGMSTDETFDEEIRRQNYQISWTQVVTKNLIMNLNYNIITDEGFLNNPYRSVRYLIDDENPAAGYLYEAELYPETHTSHAIAVRGRYYLPIRAAFLFEYRRFNDTWEINGYNLEFGYIQTFMEHWTAEARIRYYKQSAAEFYSDLFNRAGEFQYRARDKELSDFTDTTFGLGISYEFKPQWTGDWIDRASANLMVDFINFDYNNFRDLRTTTAAAGEEPLYSFDATVTRLFFSVWF
ncbi:MAG: DUF3570 domain-containing protein [Gammaproteobacteria bacterium]